MLGMVFTEFVDLVEQRFGLEMLDRVIEDAALGHEAAYTAVGYYPFSELQKLLASLCKETGADAGVLLNAFGAHLFERLRDGHPQFFAEPDLDLFGLLMRVDSVVHVEVRKLYAHAKLPKFACTRESAEVLLLRYESDRGLADLAVGLLNGAAAHFGEQIELSRVDRREGELYCTDFRIRKVPH